MTPERYRKIGELFHATLELEGEERDSLLERECAGDAELRCEVESLIRSHECDAGVIDEPALDVAATLLAENTAEQVFGHTLAGRYRVLSLLGEGGMGRVYLAEDAELGRRVALKLLPEHLTHDAEQAGRFRQEARAASALNHPNIITVYGIEQVGGSSVIASEFIEGETLRERLKSGALQPNEVLDIAAQLASALRAAHQAGIVHRDIKPENVMLRPDGYAKVLDFGIAKLAPRQTAEQNRPNGSNVKTTPGLIMGTDRYMSPEQARGQEVDARSDVWSLGCVLYEMLAGTPPFTGETAGDVVAAVLKTEPAPLAQVATRTPTELQRIVRKCLEKDRGARYRSAEELLADLRRLQKRVEAEEAGAVNSPARRTFTARFILPIALTLVVGSLALGLSFYKARNTPPVGGKKSIAVLPLKPIGLANRNEVYEIGIADSLIYKLGGMQGFVVRPLSAMRKYADMNQDPIAAGREQQADYVLASNYQLAGGKIRVTSELLNVASGEVVETYQSAEKNAGDIFATQDAIAGEVGNLLLARFASTESNHVTRRGTNNEEAYRLYLQGMYFYDKRTKPDAYKAIEVLEQAVRMDPNYARAWAGLAHAHRYLINLDVNINIHDETRKSMEAVNKALALDSNISEAYSALCENKLNYEYDFAGAETACKRAIELRPESAVARNIYSRFLMSRGRFNEATTEIKTAIDLEPTSYFHQIIYLVCLTQARRYDEAFRQMDRVAELNPGNAFKLYWGVAGALMTQENPARAFERTMRYLRLANADEQTLQVYQKIYQTGGWQGVMSEQARRINENPLEHIFYAAAIYAQINDKDKGMELLEKSYERREFWIAYLQVEPRLDSLRADPRFEALVRRVEAK